LRCQTIIPENSININAKTPLPDDFGAASDIAKNTQVFLSISNLFYILINIYNVLFGGLGRFV
jgi:hypothetical protein